MHVLRAFQNAIFSHSCASEVDKISTDIACRAAVLFKLTVTVNEKAKYLKKCNQLTVTI